MRYLRALIFLLLLPISAFAADNFTFVQIADTQLGMTKGDDMSIEIANFTKAVEQINELEPAFVVISGDLVNKAHDPRQIREFWRIARKLDASIPLYLVAGNHDIATPNEAGVRSYTRLFGPDHYTFSYENSQFIVLDSNLYCNGGAEAKLKDAQFEWFKQSLEAAKKKNPAHVFVLTHHPWFLATPDEKDEYFNVPSSERVKYLALMKDYGVDFALAGHLHKESIAKDGGLTMITTSAVSQSLGKDPVGYSVFRVSGQRAQHEYVVLGAGGR